MRLRLLGSMALVAALVGAGCTSDDEPSKAASSSSTTSTTSSTTTTSSAATSASTTSTTAFGGATTPVSVRGSAQRTALLTGVTVEHEPGVDRVTFAMRGDGLPDVDARYIDRPTADGSGADVHVDGSAYLQVRMTPAAGVDLTGEEPVRTYTGPDRVNGATTTVTEVVRTGDFEANLTWVLGARSRAPFRVTTSGSPAKVVVEMAAPQT